MIELKDGMRVRFFPNGSVVPEGFRTLRLVEGDTWHAYEDGDDAPTGVFTRAELLPWLEQGIYRPLDAPQHDAVEHPKHYTSHPSGIECIQITEHMGFNLGNAVKYIWRADLKHNAIEDLKKAKWYIERELAKREKAE